MKIKKNISLIVNLVLIVVLILIIGEIVITVTGINNHDINTAWEGTVKPIDAEISEKLPHDQYINLIDSVQKIRKLKNGDIAVGGITIFCIGITTRIMCDTCSLHQYQHLSNATSHYLYYLELPGWKLNTRDESSYFEEGKFYTEHGQGYVRTVVVDNSVKRKDGSVYNKIHIRDIPVKFGYDNTQQCIMIPVSLATSKTLQIVFTLIFAIAVLYIVFLASIFVHFIIALSKGDSFTNQNIFRLKLIAISLLVYPIAILVLNYLLRLLFHDYFLQSLDITLSDDVWKGSWKTLVAGFIFLLLYNAFRKGKSLQEEQDLTV